MSAPATGPREIWIVNATTGDRVCFGVVMQERHVGDWTVLLTWAEDDDVWWITSSHPTKSMQQAGFIAKIYPERREHSWAYFFALTSDDLDHPEPYDESS